jgi:RimJ/RimL family protein N-acetyltransferase
MTNANIIAKGENLYLRKLEIQDMDDEFMSWFEDESLMKYYTNSKNKISKESLIRSLEAGEQNNTSFTFGIFDSISNSCIGTIKLGPINLAHKISDLVVLIGKRNYHGKGLAIEAIKLGNKIAFENFELRKLFGGMYASNIASMKAYLRADWVAEAILKGHYLNNNQNEDRIEVGCFNPKYFSEIDIQHAQLLSLDDIINKYSK